MLYLLAGIFEGFKNLIWCKYLENKDELFRYQEFFMFLPESIIVRYEVFAHLHTLKLYYICSQDANWLTCNFTRTPVLRLLLQVEQTKISETLLIF